MTFDFKTPVFEAPNRPEIIFVQDFLLEDLVGGAELSMDALHKSSPVHYRTIRSQQLTRQHLIDHKDCHWVFGNFAGLQPQVIFNVSNALSYSVFEHDYKFCRYRSIEKHEMETGSPCDCGISQWGKLIENFYTKAKKVWWCSQGQLDRYHQHVPGIKHANNEILSAVFGEDFFQNIAPLIRNLPDIQKSEWITLDSDSWIKGTSDAVAWLKENNKEYRLLKNLSHREVLNELARAEGFVCLPRGGDVSNRMVTEAKLLGCQVVHNDNVQHAREDWLNNPDKEYTLNWLYGRRKVFWDQTVKFIR
jgi:hypothetical protein